MRTGIDIQNYGLDNLPIFENFRWVFDTLGPRKVGNMYQAIDAFLDFDESAEIGHVPNPALDHRTDAITAVDGGPGIRLELFQAKGDPAFPRMHLQDYRFDLTSIVGVVGDAPGYARSGGND